MDTKNLRLYFDTFLLTSKSEPRKKMGKIGAKLRQKKEVKEDVISRAGRYKEVSKKPTTMQKGG